MYKCFKKDSQIILNGKKRIQIELAMVSATVCSRFQKKVLQKKDFFKHQYIHENPAT
jgi:hypothetical protein